MTKKEDFLKNTFEPALRKHGLKLTSPRRLIAERIFASKSHFSADELVDWIKQGNAPASRATVYRTLTILEKESIVEAHDFGEGRKKYEFAVNVPHHDHIICTKCDKVIEFQNDEIEKLQEKVCRQHGVIMVGHELKLYAECPQCKQLATKS